ncbi:hypothetical protein HGG70_07865 [Rhodobacteraceae bacterium R_SAG4]|nr:hypothetical protein [Rhodobacteraceae bacterium R_SAG4]
MSAWSAFALKDDALDEIARSQVRALGLLQVGIAQNLEAQNIGFNRIEIALTPVLAQRFGP